MNETLKKLANIIDLRDNSVISELEMLLQLHDLWRNLQNRTQAEEDLTPNFQEVRTIVDFAYIHFKQCCDVELTKAIA